MRISRRIFRGRVARGCLMAAGLLTAGLTQAAQFVLSVEDGAEAPVSGFRWVLQEDTTFAVNPNNPATNADDILSLSFHASNQPVAKTQSDGSGLNGNTDGSSVNIQSVPPGRYYVSVLPYSGHSIGGMSVNVLPNGDDPNNELDAATVTVQTHPIPTAQIALFLFQDSWPLNGAPDLPEEDNPGADGIEVDWSQFNVILEEPAGRYGQNGGQVIADAFGNPLGTSYVSNCDPYTADCIATLGDGTLQPDPVTGTLLIKNLAPGKYGIIVNAPTGQGWQQTSTIEGTKVIDAWVKANEPPFFVEFGFPGPHVFMGFTQQFNQIPAGGTAAITGAVTDIHMSRPPVFDFFSGRAFPQCWTALNQMPSGETLFASPCGPDSDFTIAGVPAGSYTITIFDANLDVVIATLPITVDPAGTCNGGGSCDLGPDVGVFNWFHRLNTAIFTDTNQNGFWDADEGPAGSERGPVQVRWRDGTIYQAFGTDTEGLAPFDQVFPFFHWLVAEVGYTRDKITGATFVVDAGGPVDTTTDLFPGFGELTPQEQCTSHDLVTGACIGPIINPNTGDNLSRTETGPVLTQAFQGFLGQTNVLQFGMTPYVNFTDAVFNPPLPPVLPQYVGENGGISGMVLYATVRAEDDPELAAAEPWEPGVPRVQVALYADGDIDCLPQGDFPGSDCDIDWNGDGILDGDDLAIDDVNMNTVIDLADVDNYPLGWADPDGTCVTRCRRGPEDIDRDDPTQTLVSNANAVFDYGDALNVTWTDSWDDSQPTGCQGVNNTPASTIEPPISDDRCFDGMRNFNQVRPGVFDGGWAFADYSADALTAAGRGALVTKLDAFYADRIALVGDTDAGISKLPEAWMIPGQYIVETATPPGYKLMEEHHKNVDFGDEYVPALPQAFPATCVGDDHLVPPYLAMATMDGSGALDQLIAGIAPADAAAPFAGETRALCDRKQLQLSGAQNAAVDFYVMTDVPIAGNVSGVALNDLANEFNPNSPAFGEKYAPPFTPVGFYDWNGAEVNRVYADQYGKFNALLPSTYTANLPQPSGMSPNMIISCMNDAGPIDDGTGNLIVDPYFNPQFSQFCYTFQYMPGAITYLDTPVVSIAAFANPIGFPVDCRRPTLTPMIKQVNRRNNSGGGGPFVVGGGTVVSPQQIRILSMGGNVQVPNPEWDGTNATPRFINRNYNFGGQRGEVQLEDADGNRTNLNIVGWNGTRIFAEVDPGQAPGDYQVIVTRVGGVPEPVESPIGVTLTVGVSVSGMERGVRPNSDGAPYTADELYDIRVVTTGTSVTPIQDAIDIANPGDLILVPPGDYDELVVMWKPVKLQGYGAGSVFINARQVPTEKVLAWRAKVDLLVANGEIDPLPGQGLPLPGFPALGAPVFATEEGAGIFVAGKRTGLNRFGRPENRGARIDGVTIVGASQGGAIVANGYNQFLNISNNRLTTNAGFYGGGIRVGHPTLTNEVGGLNHTDAVNDRIRIHHNHIAQNGNTFGGAGAGISLHTGADAYRVQKNWICGNYSQGDGAGIGHFGRSHGGQIEDNIINFNESFAQANPVDGGGIFIGGKPGLQPVNGLLLSPGSGTVTIDANLIRGNLAGAGDGGGIRIHQANGVDIANSLDAIGPWYDVLVFNNMINNNTAGLAGGGISVEDSLRVVIRNNTVANNDSTATTALAFDLTDPANAVGKTLTTPQPAGIVSRLHSPEMTLLMTDVTAGNLPTDRLTFSDPVLRDDIIYQNRSFFWLNYDDPATPNFIETGLFPATPDCIASAPNCNTTNPVVDDFTDDLAVLEGLVVTTDRLDPRFSLLTDLTDYHGSNVTGDPGFVNPYFNGGRDSLNIAEFTTLQTAGAFDEGGNFIQVTYGPLSLIEPDEIVGNAEGPLLDYHIAAPSDAINNGGTTPATGRLSLDFDNEDRPATGTVSSDIGADELQ